MIDWRKVVEQHGLTTSEFEKEIYTIAACIAAVSMEDQESDMLKFTCSDNVGNLELIVRRVD